LAKKALKRIVRGEKEPVKRGTWWGEEVPHCFQWDLAVDEAKEEVGKAIASVATVIVAASILCRYLEITMWYLVQETYRIVYVIQPLLMTPRR
jgi:hypothetical protein